MVTLIIVFCISCFLSIFKLFKKPTICEQVIHTTLNILYFKKQEAYFSLVLKNVYKVLLNFNTVFTHLLKFWLRNTVFTHLLKFGLRKLFYYLHTVTTDLLKNCWPTLYSQSWQICNSYIEFTLYYWFFLSWRYKLYSQIT